MQVKRLSCFALKITDDSLRNRVLEQLSEFDNHMEAKDTLDEHRYAEEMMFKTCYIKRWQVEINKKKWCVHYLTN